MRLLLAGLTVLALAASGCGGDDSDDGGGGGSSPADEQAVRTTIDRYFKALQEEDYPTACDLLGKEARDRVAQLRGGTCPDQLRTGLAEVPKELRRDLLGDAQVARVAIDGDSASVRLRPTPFSAVGSREPLRLERASGDQWLIARFPQGGRPSAAAQCLLGGFESQRKDPEPLWEREGREDLVYFLKRACVRAERDGALAKQDEKAFERIAESVIREMIRNGRIEQTT